MSTDVQPLSVGAGERETVPGLIDCDTHPRVPGGIKTLFPYLSTAWQRRFEMRDVDQIVYVPTGRSVFPHGKAVDRQDTIPPGGGPPATDPQYMAKQLLDGYGVHSALLQCIEASQVNCWVNADEAAVLASAFNDFFVEHWLAADSRYRYAMVVAPQDPFKAAEEIRRLAGHEQIAAVWIPPVHNIQIGKPFYRPIFDAVDEVGLPALIHFNIADNNYVGNSFWGGGVPSTFCEKYTNFPSMAIGYMASAIFDGLFSRYPKLTLVLVEFGWTWLPSILYRMDTIWKGMRVEVPWIERPPSEYVLEHVRFTSEPAIELPRDWIPGYLEGMHAERTLLFSTDYPHFDSDDPTLVFTQVDEALRQRIFRENALEAIPRMA